MVPQLGRADNPFRAPPGASAVKRGIVSRVNRFLVPAAAVVALAGRPSPALALDAFEIQVYDGTADRAGAWGLELHVNGVVRGATSAAPPELPPNHQGHLTLEPSYGVTPFWELGGYLQTALLPDGAFEFAGAKARSKLVTTTAWSARSRLGVNVELSGMPRRFEAERWGLELRPIAARDFGRLSVAVNPIVGFPLMGGAATFEPAAQALFVFPGLASFGLEYYGDLGDLTSFAPAREQKHYVFEVANLLRLPSVELNVGVGEGLTATSNAFVAKLILGYTFDRGR
jgi:hypothetical protein